MTVNRKRWTDSEVVQLRAAFDEQVARAERAEAEAKAWQAKFAFAHQLVKRRRDWMEDLLTAIEEGPDEAEVRDGD